MKMQTIEAMVTTGIVSVTPDTPLRESVAVMEQNRISCLVVTEGKHPIGIFTERDLVFLASHDEHFNDLDIRDVMSTSLITANSDIDLFDAYRLLESNRIRHLVIVDDQDEISGVVTQTDIINNLGIEYFVELKSVSKIMTKNVVTIGKGASVREAVSSMARHSISCIIIEDGLRPVGILTERDIVHLFRRGEDIGTLTTESVMSRPLLTIHEEMTAHEAAGLMHRKNVRRLVVTDRSGRLSGLVTQYDIIKNFEMKYIEFLKEVIHEKERDLQEAERSLSEKTVLDNILRYSTEMAIIATDLDFRIGYYNPAAEKLFGYTAEEIIGRNVREIHDERGIDRVRFEKAAEAVAGHGTHNFNFEQVKDGTSCFIDVTITGIWNRKNVLEGFVLMAQNTTSQREAEEEAKIYYNIEAVLNWLLSLSLEEMTLEDILGHTLKLVPSIPWLSFEPMGAIFLADEEGEVLSLKVHSGLPVILQTACSKVAFGECLCGKAALTKEIEFSDSADDCHNIRYEGLVHHCHYIVPILFAGKTLGIINLYAKEGHLRSHRQDNFLTSVANTLAGVIVRKRMEQKIRENTRQLEYLNSTLEKRVLEETTKRLQQEQILIYQSRLAAMGEMISAIAHQWRQPLNAVGLIIQDLLDAYEHGEFNRDYLLKSVDESGTLINYMSKTIDDFRNFFKPSKGKTVFDAKIAIGEVFQIVSAQLRDKLISIKLTCHTHNRVFEDTSKIIWCEASLVEGFKNEFEQAVLNILNNAKDAILERKEKGLMGKDERGEIAVDFYGKDGRVIIRISDNGGGMPPEIMDRIFEPYFTTKEEGKGSGIGLYMSKIIIENNMDGKLSVGNSEKGTAFTIDMDMARGQDAGA